MPKLIQQGARQRAWRAANPDRVRAYERARPRRAPSPRARAAKRAWVAANPDLVAAQRVRDYARRRQANALPGGAACAVCGSGGNLRRDRQRGGTLCPCCLMGANAIRTPGRAAALAQYLALA
jgi:hypothetical protein